MPTTALIPALSSLRFVCKPLPISGSWSVRAYCKSKSNAVAVCDALRALDMSDFARLPSKISNDDGSFACWIGNPNPDAPTLDVEADKPFLDDFFGRFGTVAILGRF